MNDAGVIITECEQPACDCRGDEFLCPHKVCETCGQRADIYFVHGFRCLRCRQKEMTC
jgi:hypothetical protein